MIEYSVQSNHLHLVAESSDQKALSRAMIGLASRIARRLNRLWKRAGQVFPDRFHSRILRTPREVRTALIYVLQNARKHGAWRARMPDAFSSGPSFAGWRGGKECESKHVDGPHRERGTLLCGKRHRLLAQTGARCR